MQTKTLLTLSSAVPAVIKCDLRQKLPECANALNTNNKNIIMILYRWLIVNSEISAITVLPVFRNFFRIPVRFYTLSRQVFQHNLPAARRGTALPLLPPLHLNPDYRREYEYFKKLNRQTKVKHVGFSKVLSLTVLKGKNRIILGIKHRCRIKLERAKMGNRHA